MNTNDKESTWLTRNGRLYRLADRLEELSSAVRYANKPADLVYPLTSLNDLSIRIRELEWEWIAERMKLDKQDRGQWPHV